MKTNNIFKVFVALSFIATTSANAQKMNPADSAAWVNYELQVTSHLSNEIKGHHNCLDVAPEDIIVEDGKVVGMSGVIHPSWTFSCGVGGTYTIGDAKDTGKEYRTSATAEVTVEYRAYHENGKGKNARLGFYSALSFHGSTPVTIENQRTYFYGGLLDIGVTTNPCGKSQLTVAGTLGYLNSVSQEIYAGNKHIDFRSNAFFPGIMAKYAHVVGYIRRHKNYNIMGRNSDGTGKLPIELFAKVRLEGGQIGKPKVSDDIITWTGWRFAVMAGVSIPL